VNRGKTNYEKQIRYNNRGTVVSRKRRYGANYDNNHD